MATHEIRGEVHRYYVWPILVSTPRWLDGPTGKFWNTAWGHLRHWRIIRRECLR
jgi:hypothetical protein